MNGLMMQTANVCPNVFLLLPAQLERNGTSELAHASALKCKTVPLLNVGMSLLAHANARLMDYAQPLRDGTRRHANASVLQFVFVPPTKDGTLTLANANAQVPISALP